ncbi:hypothetical protein LBK6_00875 [Leptospira borgpetersenii serovar Hardjo]|nr:hypothetical protein LBK6_00875 [Leptospira borgpetersenii serovar Hardjo]AMX60232.1 hypothetical protein LBK9_00875 [Leptospira borgpetersenii serovar Hardjo]AMX63479.1 hypothetical protein LBK30_00890 [Leptospira borgpetersenii serovar Hardjo]AMX66718.1 hypothetical protein LBHA_00890 [Leptospira borgpetersenii serovar Hardjo]
MVRTSQLRPTKGFHKFHSIQRSVFLRRVVYYPIPRRSRFQFYHSYVYDFFKVFWHNLNNLFVIQLRCFEKHPEQNP